MNGQIIRDIREESLIAKLYDELRPKAKSKDKLPFWKSKGDSDG
jgi:diadenylate cyclase